MLEKKSWRDYWIGRELSVQIEQEFHIPILAIKPSVHFDNPRYEWARVLLQSPEGIEGYLEIDTHFDQLDEQLILGKPRGNLKAYKYAIPIPISAEISQRKQSGFLLPALVNVSLQSNNELIKKLEAEVTLAGRSFRSNYQIIEQDRVPEINEYRYLAYSSYWTENGTGEEHDYLLIPPQPQVITSLIFSLQLK